MCVIALLLQRDASMFQSTQDFSGTSADDESDEGEQNERATAGQSHRSRRGGCSSRGRGRRSRASISGRGMGRARGGRSSSRARGGRSSSRARGGRSSSRARGVRRAGRRVQNRARRDDECWEWNKLKDLSNKISSISFSGREPGPIGNAEGIHDPLECLHLFLPKEFYDKLLIETNRYADQQRVNDTNPWKPVSMEELMAFIGINIAMGIISLPSLDDYWSVEPILSHSWFRVIMSRNRFREILRYIHIVDNTTAPDRNNPTHDKLWKVRPLLDLLSENCRKMYALHREISIDESMIGTKCRLSFIQYMPKKPCKWGIKVWACCDAITGYIYAFDIYAGANPSVPNHPKGLAYGVVMNLLETLLHKGHVLYTDNFYSSPDLFADLLSGGTLASGTVRLNRHNFPPDLKEKVRMHRGEFKFAYYNEMTAARWYDNRDVYCLSTRFSDSLTTVRRRVDNETKDVTCPDIISDYNKHMGGVDLADQAMCYYSMGRKTMKWWRRVFWRMHDQAITNAFVICKANSSSDAKVVRQKNFRKCLVKALTAHAFELRKQPGRPVSQSLSRLTGKHYIYRTSVRRRCVVCAYKRVSARGNKRKDKKIMTWCPKCSAHLCVGSCFEVYHSRVNYRRLNN